jgi:hypothetical protein
MSINAVSCGIVGIEGTRMFAFLVEQQVTSNTFVAPLYVVFF